MSPLIVIWPSLDSHMTITPAPFLRHWDLNSIVANKSQERISSDQTLTRKDATIMIAQRLMFKSNID
jgi:hypothetical protein